MEVKIDEITWKEDWKRFSIEACTHCNKIFEHYNFSTVPACNDCLEQWESEQPKDD